MREEGYDGLLASWWHPGGQHQQRRQRWWWRLRVPRGHHGVASRVRRSAIALHFRRGTAGRARRRAGCQSGKQAPPTQHWQAPAWVHDAWPITHVLQELGTQLPRSTLPSRRRCPNPRRRPRPQRHRSHRRRSPRPPPRPPPPRRSSAPRSPPTRTHGSTRRPSGIPGRPPVVPGPSVSMSRGVSCVHPLSRYDGPGRSAQQEFD